jgi:ABC-type methionine transport system ATPase subunit
MRAVRVRLVFPERLITEPVIARTVRDFDVLVNIRRASVDESVGIVVCELSGEDEAVERAVGFLTELGVEVERLGDVVES